MVAVDGQQLVVVGGRNCVVTPPAPGEDSPGHEWCDICWPGSDDEDPGLYYNMTLHTFKPSAGTWNTVRSAGPSPSGRAYFGNAVVIEYGTVC